MPSQLAVLDQAQSTLVELAIRFGPKLVVAVLIMVAGFYVGGWVGAAFDRWIGRLQLDATIHILLHRLVRLLVLTLFFIMALQNLGVDLIPLIAGLSVAGAGVALAMQGVLGNLAAGLTIIFTRPFRVGEYISIVGIEGEVQAIDLFSTRLGHPDRSIIVVPNRKIVGEILHNYGYIRQLDLCIGIARGEDLDRALQAIEAAVRSNPRVLAEPAAFIGVTTLANASIGIAVKPWVKVPDYLPAEAEINRTMVERIQAAGVEYPLSTQPIRIVAAPASRHPLD